MMDWRSLLAGQTDGFTTPVGGARFGDGLDAVPLDRATKILTWTPGPGGGSTVKREVLLAEPREPPSAAKREALVAELREHAGRVYVDGITYEIRAGTVYRIWMRGAPLDALPFQAEADIERAFGASVVVERHGDWAMHRFPALGLSVGWQGGEERVEYVALGSVAWTSAGFDAAEILAEMREEDYHLGRRLTEIDDGLSPRGRAALALLICEAFLRRPGVSAEDHALAARGVEEAWEWVEGRPASDLCQYIDGYVDGEIGLPPRAFAYAHDSMPREIMTSAFLSIGIVASLAGGDSESVAEYTEHQWWGLRELAGGLSPREQQQLFRHEEAIRAAAAASSSARPGGYVSRRDIVGG